VVTDNSGAGGLNGMNYLYGAEPDGLTLGIVPSVKFVANEVLDEPAAAYDIEDFSYIMNVGHMPYYFMVSPDRPYQSVDALRAGEDLKIGGSSPSGAVSLGGLTVIELLDLDAKVVTGLEGEAARAPAAKRGEIAGYVIGVDTAQASMDSNMVRPLFVLASERDPHQPDVPAITELVDLTDDDLALVRLWETALVSSDIVAAPPGMPADRLAFLRGLADNWVEDEAFRQEINAVCGYDVGDYTTGEAVASAMTDLAAALGGFRTTFAEMIEKYRA
jgi:tripartite-type tricarboxylate transporter receptor subunit TctC